jgi:hypothetical protein
VECAGVVVFVMWSRFAPCSRVIYARARPIITTPHVDCGNCLRLS